MDRYGTSNLLVLLFLIELVRIVPTELVGINAPTPGMCYGSRLARDGEGSLLSVAFGIISASLAVPRLSELEMLSTP